MDKEKIETRDYLDDVTAMSPYEIARKVGCASPESRESAGAVVLAELRDDMVEAWREGRFDWHRRQYDSDVTHEVTDLTFPSSSIDVWRVFADIGIGWESEFTVGGEFTGSLEDIASDVVSQILSNAGSVIMGDIRECQGTWVCPECGDTGQPLVCSPDECNGSDEDRDEWKAELGGYFAPVEPVEISDPILDLIKEAEAVSRPPSPALHAEIAEVDAYLRRAAMVNEEEFARLTQPFGWRVTAFMGLGALAFVAVAVLAWLVN